jgi:hypothetical protein
VGRAQFVRETLGVVPKDEAKKTAWIEGLNYRDFETFRHGVGGRHAHFRAEGPQLFSDARELQRQEEELAAGEREKDAPEDAAVGAVVEESRTEAAGAEVAAGANDVKAEIAGQEPAPSASVQEPVGEQTVSAEPRPEEAAPIGLTAAAEERTQAVAVQSAEHVADLNAPAAGPQALCEDFTVPRTTPPTAATHQAYQEWLAKRLAVLRHNFVLANSLHQQLTAAPAAPNPASGAYEAQLIKWTEAMAR